MVVPHLRAKWQPPPLTPPSCWRSGKFVPHSGQCSNGATLSVPQLVSQRRPCLFTKDEVPIANLAGLSLSRLHETPNFDTSSIFRLTPAPPSHSPRQATVRSQPPSESFPPGERRKSRVTPPLARLPLPAWPRRWGLLRARPGTQARTKDGPARPCRSRHKRHPCPATIGHFAVLLAQLPPTTHLRVSSILLHPLRPFPTSRRPRATTPPPHRPSARDHPRQPIPPAPPLTP